MIFRRFEINNVERKLRSLLRNNLVFNREMWSRYVTERPVLNFRTRFGISVSSEAIILLYYYRSNINAEVTLNRRCVTICFDEGGSENSTLACRKSLGS